MSVREARANPEWVLLAVRADDGAVALQSRGDVRAARVPERAARKRRAASATRPSPALAAALRDGAVEGVEIPRAPARLGPPAAAVDGNALPFRLAPTAPCPARDGDDDGDDGGGLPTPKVPGR